MKKEIKVGDYIYQLTYYNHRFAGVERSLSKRKIKKISYGAARFADGDSVSLGSINNVLVNEWFTSKKLMYEAKLEAHLREFGDVVKEVEYLKKKTGVKQ